VDPAPIGKEVEEALERLGLRARRLVAISRADGRKHGRRVYRVELTDGRTIKARRLESEEAARRLVALRAAIEPAFAPVLDRHGPVLLEAWIEGVPLAERDTEARAAEAGALLARLHASAEARPSGAVPTRPWREGAAAELAALGDAHALGADEVATLAAELRRHDPGSVPTVLIHGDFCGENMVIDGAGRLRVIDNEWLAIAPRGFDLGRTFSRWPMSDAAWQRLVAGYRSAARVDHGPLAFWKIVAALKSAHIRLRATPERLEFSLGLLRRFARGRDGVAV
jgi:aminoglycoside phosphotransferase